MANTGNFPIIAVGILMLGALSFSKVSLSKQEIPASYDSSHKKKVEGKTRAPAKKTVSAHKFYPQPGVPMVPPPVR